MANAEMVQALEEDARRVWLRPATEVVDLRAIPGKEAESARMNGWQRAYFKGEYDEKIGMFYARLTLSRLMGGVKLSHFFDKHMPEGVRNRAEKAMSDSIVGDTNNYGFSRLPTLLAVIEEREGEIDQIACMTGTNQDYYWRDWREDSASASGSERLTDGVDLLLPAQKAAAQSLYGVMADASDEILASRIPG
jgi:hypothetical protein